MALGREQHQGAGSKLRAPTAFAGKLVDKAAAAPAEVVDKVKTAPGQAVDEVKAAAPSEVVDEVKAAPAEVVDKVESAAPSQVVDKVKAAPAEAVDKVESAARSGVAQAGPVSRDLGKELSPKRLLRTAVTAPLALLRGHLGAFGAAAGTLVLGGVAGYYAGRRRTSPL